MTIDVERPQARRTTGGAPGWVRLVGLLPAAAFLATFGLFFVDKNREARTVLDSGRGLLTMAVLVGGYLAVGFTLRRVVRWPWLPPVVLAAVVLGLAAWVVRPYYVDETANRRLLSGPVRDAGAQEGADEPAAPPMSGAPVEEVVRVSTGSLRGIDHDASGTASVLRAPDGSLVVRFEDFRIEGVPDPQLYLVDGADASEPGGVALGRLPGNQGAVLDIDVPDERGAGGGWTVLVWCGRFAVPVANATQSTT